MSAPRPAIDLQDWLTTIGLGAHAASFVTNGVDWDVLADLSDADLRELGLSLGDRRRLLKAIAARRDDSGPGPSPPSATATAAPAPPETEAERRHVSVMFVDLVGSTPLAQRLDPEEMRQVLHAFHRVAMTAIEAHEGHLASYLGDGILVYFGYPRAHEDDAVRAVRAGLAIIAALQDGNAAIEARHGVRLRLRIGIHTGLVVAGEIGAGAARDGRAIVGETPNIAARLQALAEPDTLVIGETTQRLIEGLFRLEALGARELRGVAAPIQVYRVLEESNAVNRFDARAMRGLTPLVGRAAELEMLRQRWAQACDGEMRCVLLIGEPGIGKSRTLRAFRDSIAGDAHTETVLHGSPYHQNSAFWPVLEHLKRALHRDGAAVGELAALERFTTALGPDMASAVPVLASFLGIDPGGRHQAVDPESLLFKQHLLEALVAVVAALARPTPLLLVVEDAHWLDPSTLEFLRLVQERLTGAHLLVLVTARPEFRPGWAFAHVLQINLDRLSRRDRQALVEGLTRGKRLPAAVLDQIVVRTDGVPLFVEELTKALLESGQLRDVGDRWESSGSDWTIAIPDTLQGSLLARLDRLDAEAKDIAQIGAVIGRNFRRDLLERVAGRDAAALDAALERLTAAEIVVPGPDGAHRFRHALIQDAAYQSLLLARRARYHAAIAEAIERHLPAVAETQPEIVAQHLTAAGQLDRAVDFWLRAGSRSAARLSFDEAVAQLRRGLDLVRLLGDDNKSRVARTVALLRLLGQAEPHTIGAQAQNRLGEALELARKLGDPTVFAEAALAFEEGRRNQGVMDPLSVPLLEEALAVIGSDVTSVQHSRVLSRLARTLAFTGAFERASEVNAQALALGRHLADTPSLYDSTICEVQLATAKPIAAGAFPRIFAALDDVVSMSESRGELSLVFEGLHYPLPLALAMGDPERFESTLGRFEAMAERSQSPRYRISARSTRTMELILRGRFAAAEQHAAQWFALAEAFDAEPWRGIYGLQMFTIRREQGRLAEVAPLVKRFVDQHPDNATWRPGLMLIASDLGLEASARHSLARLAVTGFEMPRDGKYTLTMSYLAEVCARLGDAARAEMLWDRLAPYRDLAVVVPIGTICGGAVARYLGLLAATLQRWDAAEAQFEAALAMNGRLGAAPQLAHTQADFAAALLGRGGPGDHVRAKELRAAARTTAERLGMATLLKRLGADGAPSTSPA